MENLKSDRSHHRLAPTQGNNPTFTHLHPPSSLLCYGLLACRRPFSPRPTISLLVGHLQLCSLCPGAACGSLYATQGHPRLWTGRQAALGAMNGGRIRSHPVLSCIRRPGVTGTLGPDTLMLVSLAMWEKIANPCYQPDEFEIWVMLF